MKEEKVLLIDIDGLIYYEAHKEKLEWAIQGIDNRMQRIFEETGTTKHISFLTEGRCFRYIKAVSKDYKGNRVSTKPKWFYVLKDYLKAQYGAISLDGLEADDCVVYFRDKFPNTQICSPDKDVIFGTEGMHYNYQMVKGDKEGEFHSKGYIHTTAKEAQEFMYTQWIMGDAGDGISGIEGVGIKTAEKWLKRWKVEVRQLTTEQHILAAYMNKYGDVSGLSRFAETFKLIYMLRTDEDMMREVKYIPEMPEVQEYVVEQESTVDDDDSVGW